MALDLLVMSQSQDDARFIMSVYTVDSVICELPAMHAGIRGACRYTLGLDALNAISCHD